MSEGRHAPSLSSLILVRIKLANRWLFPPTVIFLQIKIILMAINPPGARNHGEGSPLIRLLAIWLVSGTCFLLVVLHYKTYATAIDACGDSSGYIEIARAISKWNFSGLQVFQFWGVSYLTAFISKITSLPLRPSLVIVSAGSSLLACFFASRLWGWWVAAFFVILNFDWMQRSLLGGSEPTFMALLLGAFLLVRHEKWEWAALLASFATITRPLGLCALLAIGIVLLQRRNYSKFFRALAIGLTIGTLYIVPLRLYVHDSLANVHAYETSRPLFGIPLVAIVMGIFSDRYLTNLILSCAWVLFILSGVILFLTSDACAEKRKAWPVEFIFAGLYTLMICCYNYPQWALGNFARFAIPVIPFALLSLRRILPKNEVLVWASAFVFPVLAGASAIGIRNILH